MRRLFGNFINNKKIKRYQVIKSLKFTILLLVYYYLFSQMVYSYLVVFLLIVSLAETSVKKSFS